MDEARTEEPTARKLARAAARPPRSPDLVAALLLCALLGLLLQGGERLLAALAAFARACFSSVQAPLVAPYAALLDPLRAVLWLGAGLVLTLLVCASLVGLAQVGLVFRVGTTEAEPRPGPGERLRALFSGETWLEAGLGLLKASVLLAVCALLLGDAVRGLLALSEGTAAHAQEGLLALLSELLVRMMIVGLLLGAADLTYRRMRHRAGLRMSRRELALELRESHGAPELRAARERQRREARVLAELGGLERANVLLVDGTRALALGLADEDPAPRVLAKAAGQVAERLRQRAEQDGLPVRLEPALLHRLYGLELTELVPAAHYESVAELYRALGTQAPAP
jgi:flagellar biosynthetic protein FlhB